MSTWHSRGLSCVDELFAVSHLFFREKHRKLYVERKKTLYTLLTLSSPICKCRRECDLMGNPSFTLGPSAERWRLACLTAGQSTHIHTVRLVDGSVTVWKVEPSEYFWQMQRRRWNEQTHNAFCIYHIENLTVDGASVTEGLKFESVCEPKMVAAKLACGRSHLWKQTWDQFRPSYRSVLLTHIWCVPHR